MIWRIALLTTMSGLLLGCPTLTLRHPDDDPSRMKEIVADGDFVHEPSGVVFPTILAGCPRGKIISYRASGRDVSATYDSANPWGHLFATVYVYPRPSLRTEDDLKQHFDAILKSVVRQHAAGRVVREEECRLPRVGGQARGYVAEMRYSASLDLTNQEVASYLYLFATRNWYVKYRISYPAAQEDRLTKVRDQVLKDFEWTSRL